MFTLEFDGRRLASQEDFYRQLTTQYISVFEFGDSLDALWDWLTGELPLPLTINFNHLSQAQLQPDQPLAPIFALLFEAQLTLEGQLFITCDGVPLTEVAPSIGDNCH